MVSIYDNKYEELVSNALGELRATTDITQLTPGAKARALIEICMKEMGFAYETFSRDLLGSFIRFAQGPDLDLIAELVGLSRRQASRNVADVESEVQKFYVRSGTFGDINGAASFTIPLGTTIQTIPTASTQEPIYYVTTEDAICSPSLSEIFVGVRALEFGEDGSVGAGTLTRHNFELYDDYLDNSLLTTNIESISYAVARESDTNLKFRIVNQALTGEAANWTALRIACLAVPGVADVFPDEYYRGVGTGAIYIKSTTPTVSTYVLSTVQEEISRFRAFGNLVTGLAPPYVGVEMVVDLNLYNVIPVREQTTLLTRVRNRIYDYVNTLDINESLDVDLLLREIIKIDANIRSVGTTTKPITRLYVWKYSAAEDSRIRQQALNGYTARNFERIVVEFTQLPENQDPIIVRVAS